MAIAKINGLAKADIAKINGIEKADINKISGLTASFVQYAAVGAESGAGADYNTSYRPVMCYDTSTDRIVVAYQFRDSSDAEFALKYVVGTLSEDGSISWGTPGTIDGGATTGTPSNGGTERKIVKPLCMEFNSNINKIQIAYIVYHPAQTTDHKFYTKVGTVTGGTTNTVAWAVSGDANSNNVLNNEAPIKARMAFNSAVNKMYIHYKWVNESVGGSDEPENNVRELTSDTSTPDLDIVTLKRPDGSTQFHPWKDGTGSLNQQDWTGITFADSVDRMLVCTLSNDSSGGHPTGRMNVMLCDSSNNNIVAGDYNGGYGFTADEDGHSHEEAAIAWDENLDKFLWVFRDADDNNYLKGIVGTLTSDTQSGTSYANIKPSYPLGSPDNTETAITDVAVTGVNVIYNAAANAQHFIVSYVRNDTYDDIAFRTVTLNSSDNSFVVGAEKVLHTGGSSSEAKDWSNATYSPYSNDMAYCPDGTSGVLICYQYERDLGAGAGGQLTTYVRRLAALGTNYGQTAG